MELNMKFLSRKTEFLYSCKTYSNKLVYNFFVFLQCRYKAANVTIQKYFKILQLKVHIWCMLLDHFL